MADEKLCFVIMPFESSCDKVYEAIKKAGVFVGFRVERADERFAIDKIPERIEKLLQSADLLVADVSEENPNVYYELGLAHAKNKPVILICRDGVHIPFDIHHWSHVRYDDENTLKRNLLKIFDNVSEQIVIKKDRLKEQIPNDIELGHLAVKCGIISNQILNWRIDEIRSGKSECDTLFELLVKNGDINEEQAKVLLHSQDWVTRYIQAVSQSFSEPVWIRQLHRTIQFLSWRNKSERHPPIETRYIDAIDKDLDIYDEALYFDHILFQKFSKGFFSAKSTGTVVIREMETDQYEIFVPESTSKFYRKSHGSSLDYCIKVKEGCRFPLLVERSFLYLNGFQYSEDEDNREAGIRIKEPVEEIILTLDFQKLPMEVKEIRGEMRYESHKEPLEIKKAGSRCFYTSSADPPRGAAIYMVWKWVQTEDN